MFTELAAFLGISTLVIVTPGQDAVTGGSNRRAVPLVAYRQGLISNLGNPKMAVVFTSLLPQFAPDGEATFLALPGLGLVFCAMTLGWLAGFAVVVAKAGDSLRRSKIRRALDGLLGTILVAFGIRLATAHR